MSALKDINDMITTEVITGLLGKFISSTGKSNDEIKDGYEDLKSNLDSIPSNTGLMVTKLNNKIVIVILDELNEMKTKNKPTIINLQQLIEDEIL